MRRCIVLLFNVLLALPFTVGTAAAAASTPSVGTAARTVDLRTAPGAVRYGDGWALPLRGSQPAWYTAELRQQVLAANGAPVAAPAEAPLPSEVGIRPGAWMLSPSGCTMNFIFRSGSNYAIGTAGHCANAGDPVVLITVAPGGANPVLVDVGTASVSHNNGVGDDFALVPINPVLNSWVDPTTAVIGGPCGRYTGSGPETVRHYGHGLAIGTGGTPRAGVALTWTANSFGWDSPAIFGDSGSAVMVTDFAAAGDLTHLVVDTNWLPSFVAGKRIDTMLSIAGGWSLANSALCL
jgi:hypothetical protein